MKKLFSKQPLLLLSFTILFTGCASSKYNNLINTTKNTYELALSEKAWMASIDPPQKGRVGLDPEIMSRFAARLCDAQRDNSNFYTSIQYTNEISTLDTIDDNQCKIDIERQLERLISQQKDPQELIVDDLLPPNSRQFIVAIRNIRDNLLVSSYDAASCYISEDRNLPTAVTASMSAYWALDEEKWLKATSIIQAALEKNWKCSVDAGYNKQPYLELNWARLTFQMILGTLSTVKIMLPELERLANQCSLTNVYNTLNTESVALISAMQKDPLIEIYSALSLEKTGPIPQAYISDIKRHLSKLQRIRDKYLEQLSNVYHFIGKISNSNNREVLAAKASQKFSTLAELFSFELNNNVEIFELHSQLYWSHLLRLASLTNADQKIIKSYEALLIENRDYSKQQKSKIACIATSANILAETFKTMSRYESGISRNEKQKILADISNSEHCRLFDKSCLPQYPANEKCNNQLSNSREYWRDYSKHQLISFRNKVSSFDKDANSLSSIGDISTLRNIAISIFLRAVEFNLKAIGSASACDLE